MKDTEFSCFANYHSENNISLSEIIKHINWGSNRVIKQQGFRIASIMKPLQHIKSWDRIIDPSFQIKESCFISKPKGQSIIVIHIGNK